MSSIKREIRHFPVVVVQWRQKSVQKKRDVRAELLLCLFQKIAYFNSLSSPLWHPKVPIIYHFSSVLVRSDKASIPNWLFSSMNSSSTWMIFNASSEQRARASKVALRSKMGPLPHFKRKTYDLKTSTKKTRMSWIRRRESVQRGQRLKQNKS